MTDWDLYWITADARQAQRPARRQASKAQRVTIKELVRIFLHLK